MFKFHFLDIFKKFYIQWRIEQHLVDGGFHKKNSVLILIYRNSKGNKLELVSKFKQCVQYYMNGTNDGFLKYRPRLGQCKNNINIFNNSKKSCFQKHFNC